MKTPGKVKEALEHVQKFHPEVTHVMFFRDGRWLYLTDDGDAPVFSPSIDVGLLEDAADSVEQLPSAFAV